MNDIDKSISSKIYLEQLNACRLNLKVLFLSDMTNNKGNSLTKDILLATGEKYFDSKYPFQYFKLRKMYDTNK